MKLWAVVFREDTFEGTWGVDDDYYLIGVYDSEVKANEVVQLYENTCDRATGYSDVDVIPIELNKTEQTLIGNTSYIE